MEEAHLKELVEKGLSTYKIAALENVASSTVRYWLRKFNLKTVRGKHGKVPKDFDFPRKCACGETDANKFYGNKKSICGKCQSKYNLKKGQVNRQRALEFLGNKCVICEYNTYTCSLDIHHLNPDGKDPNFRSYRGWSWGRIKEELSECVLLCRNCHAAVHTGCLKM